MIGVTQACRRLDQGIKHGLQVEVRATDDPERVSRGRLLLERLAQLRFLAFELADVGNGADQSQYPSVCVSNRACAVAHPAPLTTLVEKAIFASEMRHDSFEVGGRRLTVPIPIVGVDMFQPTLRRKLTFLETEHLVQSGREF